MVLAEYENRKGVFMLTNPVLISVIVMIVLCLIKVNVLLALLISALVGGMIAGIPLGESMGLLIGGMQGNAETALSYVLLGALAAAIGKTGAAEMLAKRISRIVGEGRFILILLITVVACLSQNLIPVHIAFIPILIPPLISVFNRLKIDRRGVACGLTFGLKAPYVMLPVGFGFIFHRTIASAAVDNGLDFAIGDVWKSMLLPGIGMILGLFIAIFISYRKPREYKEVDVIDEDIYEDLTMKKEHWGALLGAAAAFIIQIRTESLPLGAIAGLIIMLVMGSFKWNEMDKIMNEGIKIMGFIAFVMLVAAGYGAVIRETGGVDALVKASVTLMRGSKVIAAIVMLGIGLIITMGIGTSFGTVPILATIFVPLALELNFSPAAIISLLGTAGALGDAGSPASDSTLGPTSGLNVDGQHDHIWDTCVPTFIHYNIPLLIFGTIAALIL